MLLKDINEIKGVVSDWSRDVFYSEFASNFLNLIDGEGSNVSSSVLPSVVWGLLVGGSVFIFLIIYALIENSKMVEKGKELIFIGVAFFFGFLLLSFDETSSNSNKDEVFLNNMNDEQIITLYNSIVSVKLLEGELNQEDNVNGLVKLYQLTNDKRSEDYFHYDDKNTQDDYISYVLKVKNISKDFGK